MHRQQHSLDEDLVHAGRLQRSSPQYQDSAYVWKLAMCFSISVAWLAGTWRAHGCVIRGHLPIQCHHLLHQASLFGFFLVPDPQSSWGEAASPAMTYWCNTLGKTGVMQAVPGR